jgi:hypothetical protein
MSKSISHPESTQQFPVKYLQSARRRYQIGEIEVRSGEQPHMSLGNYRSLSSPKRFAIHINPDPEPDTIVTQIMHLGTKDRYELVLHIANYGNKTVSVTIWQL